MLSECCLSSELTHSGFKYRVVNLNKLLPCRRLGIPTRPLHSEWALQPIILGLCTGDVDASIPDRVQEPILYLVVDDGTVYLHRSVLQL